MLEDVADNQVARTGFALGIPCRHDAARHGGMACNDIYDVAVLRPQNEREIFAKGLIQPRRIPFRINGPRRMRGEGRAIGIPPPGEVGG